MLLLRVLQTYTKRLYLNDTSGYFEGHKPLRFGRIYEREQLYVNGLPIEIWMEKFVSCVLLEGR